jgi:hypothetical protein
VVIVIDENHSWTQILGPGNLCPYINSLAAAGANMTQSFAIEHPSQPNYFDLFSGGNQGVTSDACPVGPFSSPNLAQGLISAGFTFGGYSEGLPSAGSTVCGAGTSPHIYQRKHNPWVNFTNIPSAVNMPFTDFQALAGQYENLPTVSIVIPDMWNDMHNGFPSVGDSWLQANLDGYYQWAKGHNSLLIVTFDEDDSSASNQIPTIFAGPMVVPGQYSNPINHYNVLRTLEDMYGLSHSGNAAAAAPITQIFDCVSVFPTVTPSTPGITATPTATAVIGSNSVALVQNPVTTEMAALRVMLRVPTDSFTLKVYTTAYRKVKQQSFSYFPAGVTHLSLDLKDDWGTPLANGLYYVQVTVPGFSTMVKLLLVR